MRKEGLLLAFPPVIVYNVIFHYETPEDKIFTGTLQIDYIQNDRQSKTQFFPDNITETCCKVAETNAGRFTHLNLSSC